MCCAAFLQLSHPNVLNLACNVTPHSFTPTDNETCNGANPFTTWPLQTSFLHLLHFLQQFLQAVSVFQRQTTGSCGITPAQLTLQALQDVVCNGVMESELGNHGNGTPSSEGVELQRHHKNDSMGRKKSSTDFNSQIRLVLSLYARHSQAGRQDTAGSLNGAFQTSTKNRK